MAEKISLGKALGTKAADLKKAHSGHKGDKTEYSGGGDLPPIEHGIAKLINIKVDVYKDGKLKGKPFFSATGIVLSPATTKYKDMDVPVAGKRTRIQEPICDTPERSSRKTLADHWAWVLNELRKLGMDTSKYDDPDELIEASNRFLIEAETQFNFRTWRGEPSKQYPNPMTNHDWGGAVTDANRVTTDAMEAGATEVVEDAPTDAGSQQGGSDNEPSIDINNIDELAKSAMENDETAQARLSEIALQNDITEKEIEESDSWDQIALMIKQKMGGEPAASSQEDWSEIGAAADGGDQEAADKITAKCAELEIDPNSVGTWSELIELINQQTPVDEGPWEPKVGLKCHWKPKGSKTVREVEIMAVFPEKKTVNIKTVDDGKSFKAIPVDQVSE